MTLPVTPVMCAAGLLSTRFEPQPIRSRERMDSFRPVVRSGFDNAARYCTDAVARVSSTTYTKPGLLRDHI